MAIGVINKNVVVVVALKDTGKNDPTDKAYHGGGKNNNKSVDTMTATKYNFKKKWPLSMVIINYHDHVYIKKKNALAIVVTITTMKKIWTTEATERNNNCCTAVSPIANNPF